MINNFYFIGFGSIAKSLIEIWQLEKLYKNNKITIIEPLDIPEWCFSYHNRMKHIKKSITFKNHKKLLKSINHRTIVIDLSVNVDCLMIIDICNKKGSCYVNTSLENWETYKNKPIDNYEDIKEDTLYHRRILLEEKESNADHTILTDIGFNPGFINIMTLCAIDLLTKNIKHDQDDDTKYPEGNNFYSNYCRESKLVSIQIVELDTQVTKLEPSKDLFLNTWSCLGWESEAVDNVMMGYNPQDPDFKNNKYLNEYNLIFPDEGDMNVVFLPVRGMDLSRESITLDLEGEPIPYTGYMIPHGEANTLSAFLTSLDESDELYRPSVYYVYQPCQACITSTNNMRDNKYKPLPNWYVLNLEDIDNGYDSIGVLFTFEDGKRIIFCSVVDTEFCKSKGFKFTNSTGLQVSASLNASIKYILKHQKEGLIDPEDLPHQWIFREAEKYLGKIYFKELI